MKTLGKSILIVVVLAFALSAIGCDWLFPVSIDKVTSDATKYMSNENKPLRLQLSITSSLASYSIDMSFAVGKGKITDSYSTTYYEIVDDDVTVFTQLNASGEWLVETIPIAELEQTHSEKALKGYQGVDIMRKVAINGYLERITPLFEMLNKNHKYAEHTGSKYSITSADGLNALAKSYQTEFVTNDELLFDTCYYVIKSGKLEEVYLDGESNISSSDSPNRIAHHLKLTYSATVQIPDEARSAASA